WDVYRDVEGKEPIRVICGYRSPETNAMLRRRSSGVARFSQHMLGKAIDFYIPGVPLETLREAGLRAQRGGVGYYPSSGAPFVHLDTGSVRHWPRVPEVQLARILSKGPVTRLASDERPARTTVAAASNPFARLFGSVNVADTREDDDHDGAPTPASSRKPVAAPRPEPQRPMVVAAAEPRSEAIAV